MGFDRFYGYNCQRHAHIIIHIIYGMMIVAIVMG